MRKVYYYVKLGLNRVTAFVLAAKANNMVAKMTGNPAYATPVPALADVTAASNVLTAAIDAHVLNPGPREKAARDQAFDNLKGLVIDLGGYVQAASNGKRDLIESAGCEVRKSAAPVGELAAPGKVQAYATALKGRVDVRWGGVRGRLLYNLYSCIGDPNNEDNWSLQLQTSKNRHSIEGLKSGDTYFFAIRAVGVAGISPMSDVTSAKAA